MQREVRFEIAYPWSIAYMFLGFTVVYIRQTKLVQVKEEKIKWLEIY